VVTRVLKRAWEIVHDTPDRALHPFRRQRATQELRGQVPKTVVFICQGNICRSPFAAGYFQRLAGTALKQRIATSSVGFISPGRGAPPAALAAASRRGVDLSRHRSRLVSAKVLRTAELLVVMSPEQARAIRRLAKRPVQVLVLGDLDPELIPSRTIVDPWGASDDVFDASYDRIERCVGALVRLMTEDSGGSAPETEPTSRASSADSAGRAARGTSRQGLPR
jgi:protein-tyrosine phosphatase